MRSDTIGAIHARHAAEIAAFQKRCRHRKSTWTQNMWAPGHFYSEVRICDRCGKILEERNAMLKGTTTVTSKSVPIWIEMPREEKRGPVVGAEGVKIGRKA